MRGVSSLITIVSFMTSLAFGRRSLLLPNRAAQTPASDSRASFSTSVTHKCMGGDTARDGCCTAANQEQEIRRRQRGASLCVGKVNGA